MNFIEDMQYADAHVARAIEIMTGLRRGAGDVSYSGSPNINDALMGDMIPGSYDGVGIFPPHLTEGPVSIAEMVPHLPEGSTIINIPQGFAPVVMDGVLTLIENGGVDLEAMASFDEALLSFTTSSELGEATVEFLQHAGEANASLIVGPNGKLIGEVGANYEANLINAEGNLSYGDLDLSGSFTVGLDANASANLAFDPLAGAIEIGAEAELTIGATAEANINYDVLGLGIADVYANGDAFAGATVAGTANVDIDILGGTLHAEAGFDAFAGASAGFEAGIDTDFVDVQVQGDVWAGIGATGHVDVGLNDEGEFVIGANLGLAIGVGAELGVQVAVDVENIKENVMAFASNFDESLDQLIDGDVGGAVNSALDTIENATEVVSDSVETLTGTASGLVEGATGVVAGVLEFVGLDPVSDIVEDVGGVISGAINDAGTFVADGIDTVGDWVDDAGDWLEETLTPVTDFVTDVVDQVEETVEEVKDWVEDTVEDVKDKVEDVVEGIGGVFEDVGEVLFGWLPPSF